MALSTVDCRLSCCGKLIRRKRHAQAHELIIKFDLLCCQYTHAHTHSHTRKRVYMSICAEYAKVTNKLRSKRRLGNVLIEMDLASIWLTRPQLEGIMNSFIKHDNGQTVKEREGERGKRDKSPFEKQLQSV